MENLEVLTPKYMKLCWKVVPKTYEPVFSFLRLFYNPATQMATVTLLRVKQSEVIIDRKARLAPACCHVIAVALDLLPTTWNCIETCREVVLLY